jgi:hypothetical protein
MKSKKLFSLLVTAGVVLAGASACGTTKGTSGSSAAASTSVVTTAPATSNVTSKVTSAVTTSQAPITSSETPSSVVSSEVLIDIPFSTEANLADKTISYWSGEKVTVSKAKKGDGNFAFTYTSTTGANWLGFQVLYKNPDLTSGKAYKVAFTLHSSVIGNITVNGKAITLAVGDNAIDQKYVCGTDTGATTGLDLIMGNADDGLVAAADFTITMPTWTETDLHVYTNADWKNVMNNSSYPGTGKEYYFDDYETKGEIVEDGNDTERSNGLVKTGVTVDDYYTVTMNAQGEQAYPVTAREQVGIVPWYVDDSNWIMFYIDYNPSERPSTLWQFQLTGYVNGTHVGFNDFWGDQSPYKDYASAPNIKNGFKVEVAKVTTKTGLARSFTCYFNNQLVGSRTFTTIADAATYGFCIRGDVVTVTDVTYTKTSEPDRVYSIVMQGATAPTYTVNTDKSVTLTAGTASDGFLADFVAYDDPMAAQDYAISSTITGTMAYPVTAEVQEGFLCWYKDNANYVVAYLRWAPDTGCESAIRNLEFTGTIAGTWVGWNDRWMDQSVVTTDTQYAPTSAIKFRVNKVGSTFQGFVNDRAIGDPVDYAAFDSGNTVDWTAQTKVGYYDHITTATFTSMSVTNASRSYSIFNKGTNVPLWSVDKDENVTLSSGTATDGFLGDIVSYKDALATGDYTVTSTITGTQAYPVTAELNEGLLCWYKDANNYLIAYLRWAPDTGLESTIRNAEITGKIGGADVGWHDFWFASTIAADAKYTPTAAITFCVKKVGSTFQPLVNGTAVGDAVDFASYDTTSAITWADASAKVGYYAYRTSATYSSIVCAAVV